MHADAELTTKKKRQDLCALCPLNVLSIWLSLVQPVEGHYA
jgi:hypothetical protein